MSQKWQYSMNLTLKLKLSPRYYWYHKLSYNMPQLLIKNTNNMSALSITKT